MINKIEDKIKLAFAISVGSFITSLVVVVIVCVFAYSLINEQRKNLYVIDHNVPVLVQQTQLGTNREVEMEAHVNLYHMLFFTLPPDDAYIKNNLTKAMYLVDETGLAQYNNLKEKGYYNSILASSALLTIQTDSVQVDSEKRFRYYAKQRIERETSILTRQLVTEGVLQDVPRTQNNPHGLIIKGWRTVLNKDIENVEKKRF
ncbi:conjugative transposon protein TraK [Rufibacter sp. XAAS-G3-1]|uniref:conjugative transposon protein TraK n=1 Tax=Rufibacter sp. XAAS-G3-1 TaxID=2729134 RepID=UPI0015E76EAD|nr:conjugative transposon protein TraK [Rufibacter sp. XAAS-G3-1]